MDALRKAEQQKQQERGTADGAASGQEVDALMLEPQPEQPKKTADAGNAAASRSDRLPELPKRMEELDEQFFSIPQTPRKTSGIRSPVPPHATTGGKTSADASRVGAQNLFSVKQPAAPVGRGFAIAVGAATLVAIVVIGAYFYWQLQPKGSLMVSPASTASPSSPAAPQSSERVAAAPPSPAMNPAPATPPALASPDSNAAKPHEAAILAKSPASPSSRVASASLAPPSSERQRLAEVDPATIVASDITLRKNKQAVRGDDTPEAAYAAFTRGEYEHARSLWSKILRHDNRNLDALLGMAALAQQEGKPGLAERFFRQVIELDPKNPVANAGLLALDPPTDPRLAESRLKGLLAEQPDSPHLHFALGNLYSSESRWAEAQQAFFKAHVADPDNADILYNLAVSLDHLHQDRLAAQYYARALAAARPGQTTFDPTQAEARLQALQAAQSR